MDTTPVVPPPKITLNGITTILGSKEALYKVAVPAKPGQPAQDQSYMMGEGESDNDIQVVKIDTDADVVTFNNHGTIQQLPLTAAGNISSGAAGAVSSAGGAAPGLPLPGNRFRRPGGPGFGGGAMSPAAVPILHKLQMPVARRWPLAHPIHRSIIPEQINPTNCRPRPQL